MAVTFLDRASGGTESLIGYADGLDAAEMRERLALSTRYLANWYKATKSSDNKDIWWARIDSVRAKVESTYALLTQPANTTFAGKHEIAAYNDTADSWAALYRDITQSLDTFDVGLMDQAADMLTTIAEAPGLIIPQIGDELGKIIGGTFGNFLAGTWPYIAAIGAVGLIYVFREPLSKLAGKVVK